MQRTSLTYIEFLEKLSLALLAEREHDLGNRKVCYWDEEKGISEYSPYTAKQLINKMQQDQFTDLRSS